MSLFPALAWICRQTNMKKFPIDIHLNSLFILHCNIFYLLLKESLHITHSPNQNAEVGSELNRANKSKRLAQRVKPSRRHIKTGKGVICGWVTREIRHWKAVRKMTQRMQRFIWGGPVKEWVHERSWPEGNKSNWERQLMPRGSPFLGRSCSDQSDNSKAFQFCCWIKAGMRPFAPWLYAVHTSFSAG